MCTGKIYKCKMPTYPNIKISMNIVSNMLFEKLLLEVQTLKCSKNYRQIPKYININNIIPDLIVLLSANLFCVFMSRIFQSSNNIIFLSK